ncbi:MAG: helix-turn-helix transcriptional regulator [Flavobacterium sp.]|nr:helix-turn-helix transcriptional regulator [Flavobacterium sp.]
MYNDDKHSEKEYLIALGKQIRTIRLSKNLRQTEFAYRCNFDKSNYNTIESGKRNPTITSLIKIEKALEVSILVILNFEI